MIWQRISKIKKLKPEKKRQILRLPAPQPVAAGALSRAEMDAELKKGMESVKSGKLYTADEIDAELAKEFGI